MNRKFFPFSLLLCVVNIFIGCFSHAPSRNLATVYRLVYENPDSAVCILSQIDRNLLNPADKAYCTLLYAMALDKTGPDLDHDSLIRTAYDYYKIRVSDSLYSKCMYYMGKYYVLNDSMRQGLRCLELAIRHSEENGDLYTQYLALDRLSSALQLSNPYLAVRLEKRAYEIFCRYDSGNFYNRVSLLKNIGNRYNMVPDKDSVMYYMKLALDVARQSRNKQLLSRTYHSLSIAYQKNDMPDSALLYIKKSMESDTSIENSAYLQLASCYIDLDSLDLAEHALHRVSVKENSSMSYAVNRELLHIELLRQGNSKATLYVDSALNSLIKVYQETERDNYGYLQNNIALQTDLEWFEHERMLMSVIYIFVFLFIVSVICFISYIIHYRKKVALQQSQLRVKELSITNALIQAEKDKQDLVLQNRSKQVEIMRKYIIKVSDIETTIKSIKSVSQFDQLPEETWLEISAFLNETELGFVDVLSSRYPELSSKDLRFLMLVKLGFTNSDLEKLCLRTSQAIKQRLLNYKIKLGIEERDYSTREFILNHFYD